MKYLSLCAIMKNEARYIREWLLFHLEVGVEHFYLYDNGVVCGTGDAVRSAPDLAKHCTIVNWPAMTSQFDAYLHCIREFQHESRWISFIDIDEFLFASTHDNLNEVLIDYETFPAVAVSWLMFGTSGVYERPPGLVTETFIKRGDTSLVNHGRQNIYGRDDKGQPLYWPFFCEIKSVVNPREVVGIITPHSFRYAKGYAVDEEFSPIDSYPETAFARRKRVTVNRLRLHHYWSKSVTEFQEKLERGRAVARVSYDYLTAYSRESLMNCVEDLSALPIAGRIKGRWVDLECRRPSTASAHGDSFFRQSPMKPETRVYPVSCAGLDFRFHVQDPQDTVQSKHAAGKFYEEAELLYLHGAMAGDRRVCIDVGSNTGNHATFFSRVMKFQRVVCVEPSNRSGALLRMNVAENNLDNVDLTYLGLGLSKADAVAHITYPYEHNLAAARLAPQEPDDIVNAVSCVPGDILLVREPVVSFIMIDVEGMEVDVLNGLRATILRQAPEIFIEVLDCNRPHFEQFLLEVHYGIVSSSQIYQYVCNYHIRSIRS